MTLHEFVHDSVVAVVNRLFLFCRVLERSLHAEFHHTEEICEEWLEQLELLRQCLASLECVVLNCTNPQLPATEVGIHRLSGCSSDIHCALDALKNQDQVVEDRIYDALSYVSGIRYDLEKLQSDFRSEIAPLVTGLETDTNAHELLTLRYKELHVALLDGDDFLRCIASRSLFLAVYYAAVVRPQLWSPQLHEKFVRIYEDVLQAMEPGRLRQSVQARFAFYRSSTPSQYTLRTQGTSASDMDGSDASYFYTRGRNVGVR